MSRRDPSRALCVTFIYLFVLQATAINPECTSNPECTDDRACINDACVDPCRGACGERAACSVHEHSPVCTCPDGTSGDPYTSCEEPTSSPAPEIQPTNPCNPTPCGPHSTCTVIQDNYNCTPCEDGYIGSPPNCIPECTVNAHCGMEEACVNENCVDPCSGLCGTCASCTVTEHVPECSCRSGVGDPYIECIITSMSDCVTTVEQLGPITTASMPVSKTDPVAHSRSVCPPPVMTPHGTFEMIGSEQLPVLKFSCADGLIVSGANVLYCENGRWSADFPTCVAVCVLEPHHSVEYNCVVKGGEGTRQCERLEPVGTLVNPKCRRPNYSAANDLNYMRCLSTGVWNYIAKCTPVKLGGTFQGNRGRGFEPKLGSENKVLDGRSPDDPSYETAFVRTNGNPNGLGSPSLPKLPSDAKPEINSDSGKFGFESEYPEDEDNYTGFMSISRDLDPVTESTYQNSPAEYTQMTFNHKPLPTFAPNVPPIPMPPPKATFPSHPSSYPGLYACYPSPCGPNSVCHSMNGHAVCSCKEDGRCVLEWKLRTASEGECRSTVYAGRFQPGNLGERSMSSIGRQKTDDNNDTADAIGSPPFCRPCSINADCDLSQACLSGSCTDPCPGSCGARATCHVFDHVPACSCAAGDTGDPFVACKAITDVTTVRDPCSASPCGPHAVCRTVRGHAACKCKSGFFGAPPHCRPCQYDGDCSPTLACYNGTCADPCDKTCGVLASCSVHDHLAVCTCPSGFTGDPFEECSAEQCGIWKNATSCPTATDIGLPPWHVSINQSYGGDLFYMECAGSLLSSRHVISAAHCFWNEVTRSAFPETRFRVLADDGKQFVTVLSILLPTWYRGLGGPQNSNYAVITLATPIVLSATVTPICITPGNGAGRFLTHMLRGRILTFSPFHESQELVYRVDVSTCGASEGTNTGYITKDTVCMDKSDTMVLCFQDSGTAVAFPSEGRYYLHGVITCATDDDSGIPYTTVEMNETLIKQVTV